MANLLVPAEIEISLDGGDVLYRDKKSGLIIVPWKPEAAQRGEHRVRWTVNGGSYREFGVRVK